MRNYAATNPLEKFPGNNLIDALVAIVVEACFDKLVELNGLRDFFYIAIEDLFRYESSFVKSIDKVLLTALGTDLISFFREWRQREPRTVQAFEDTIKEFTYTYPSSLWTKDEIVEAIESTDYIQYNIRPFIQGFVDRYNDSDSNHGR